MRAGCEEDPRSRLLVPVRKLVRSPTSLGQFRMILNYKPQAPGGWARKRQATSLTGSPRDDRISYYDKLYRSKEKRPSQDHTAGSPDHRQALGIPEAGTRPEVDHLNLVQGIRDRDV